MKVSIKSIAAALRLSPQAVSSALNGKSGTSKVSPETAVRVKSYAQKVGYRPSLAGKSLRSNSLGQIGILVESDFGNLHHIPVLQMGAIIGLNSYLLQNDWNLNVIEDTGQRVAGKALPRYLREHVVDGVIVCSSSPERDVALLADLKRFSIPSVLVNSPHEYNNVILDDRTGAQLATRHLIDAGHRDIVFVGDRVNHYSYSERLSGYRDTMTASGLRPFDYDMNLSFGHDMTYLARLEYYDQRGRALVNDLIKARRPTALFCYYDHLALVVMRALREAGYSVPGDISLVGYDDMPYMDMLSPAFTTVHSDFYRMGQLAGEMLVQLIKNPKQPIPSKIVVPELVIRESTRSLKSEKRK